MARSTDINQRIILSGADEVRRHLEEIAAAGQRAGNTTRAALLSATQGMGQFAAGAQASNRASRQMQFGLTQLTFQLNDVATSLASGISPMQTFAQQGGQIFQIFQQQGGAQLFRGLASAIGSMITPMTAAAAAAIALAGGFALVISRAVSLEASTREFDVVLKGLGKTSKATGAQLTLAANNLRDVGLSFAEGQAAILDATRQGVDPRQAERIVRIGQNLNTVLGEGSMERFVAAVGKGGEPLREIGMQLGLIPKEAANAAQGIDAVGQSVSRSTQAINDAIISRNRTIRDETRQRNLAIADLTRQKGTAEEEIQLASNRRIEEINRQHVETVNEMLRQRNIDNAKQLAEYNKQILDAAQKTVGDQGLISQIEGRVQGLNEAALGPFNKAMRELNIEWNNFMLELAQSEAIQWVIKDMTLLLEVVKELLKEIPKIWGGGGGAIGGDFGGGGDLPRRAEGGLVQGPGTGTSDSILARLSNGEYVVNALATRMNLPILEAMNALRRPLMPSRSRGPRFATGGLVGAGGSGGAIYLSFPGGATVGPMMGDRAVRQALEREARKAGMLSAGRKPSTV